MMEVERATLDALASLLLERAGLKITPDGYHSLRLALSARMPALGLSDAADYVQRLRGLAGEHELRSLLPYVTVGKTDFFRDPRQMHALETKLIRETLNRARLENRKATLWSAGCATGEEPYTLAMMLVEAAAQPSEVDLLATDVNPAAIEAAKVGRYPLRRLNGVSPQRLSRYFLRTEEGQYEVVPKLREYVKFEGHNLAAPVLPHGHDSSLDLILCRNVIIYFDFQTIRAVMDRFLMALRPGGTLLLGYSESLFQVYDKFEMVEIEGAFVYQRAKPGTEPKKKKMLELTSKPAAAPTLRKVPLPPAQGGQFTALPFRLPTPAPVSNVHTSPAIRLNDVGAQLERGEFDAALKGVKTLLDDHPNELGALLTLGNISSLLGKVDEAKEAFASALQREPLCVEARIYASMASLQVGKLEEARADLNKALFLEPTLAIGHYLLAQVLERIGELEGARRSYKNVIEQIRFPQRPLAGHYPDLTASVESISRAARYALAHLEEQGTH
jgi:chemotaxis protein methyltransferase CheR